MRTTLAAVLGMLSGAAFAGDPATVSPYRHFLDTPAELAQIYPDLTATELNYLVFRIADARSMLTLNAVPVAAITSVNPQACFGEARADLAHAFPSLDRQGLDELSDRIAEARSAM
jgi:hypothetical protein